MHANQQPLGSTTFAFGPPGIPQRHVQIVDPSAMSVEPDAQGQLIYGAVSSSGVPATQYIQTSPSDSAIYNQPSIVLSQDNSQNDMEIEPIDLEEVQKIQARMPAADPTAPIGSNKNPIRIIQQGNQYITTQDVSDEHLQQIIQVLTNQALISSSGSRPSAIYNRLTNRRIIFRVTRAKRRHDDITNTSLRVDRTKAAQAARAALRNRTPGKANNNRKRRKKGSDEEDPDFEPEVPEEEILPFPLARRTSTSGRVSKPPKHLVKDYKHLRLEDLTVKPESSEDDEHSDGGYSDYINDGLSGEEDEYVEGKGGTKYPCPSCDKVYMSRSGLNKHQSTVHGVSQSQAKPRPINPYVASMRRRTKLKEAVAEATDDDLIEFVAPRLSKLISPWDHLLLRSEDGDPPLPQVPRVVLDYLNLVERARAFLGEQLELRPTAQKKRKPESPKEVSDAGAHDTDVADNKESKANDEVAPLTTTVENGDTANGDVSTDAPADQDVQPSEETKSTESTQNGVAKEEHPEKKTSETNDTPAAESTEQTGVVDEDEGDEDDEDLDENAIIVKIEKVEQSTALGLPCGKYVVKEPLCEDYLPRRFRSALATLRAQASSTAAVSSSDVGNEAQEPPKRRALVAMETADDDDVAATLRSDAQLDDEASTVGAIPQNDASTTSGDNQTQGGVLTLGDELLLLPEGGLGGPVPDEWLTSGAFLTVLTETGETSDLVMEAATGRLFHKPTGHLVSLADGSGAHATQPQEDAPAPEYGYEDEQGATTTEAQSGGNSGQQNGSVDGTSAEQTEVIDPVSQQEQLLAQMAENGEVIDLNTLFPGVTVTEVSPGVCLVTKPNGDRFNVEHGGEGITLETLQTILQMDA